MFYLRSESCRNTVEYKQRLRNADDFVVPRPYNAYYMKTYRYLAPHIFNKLPDFIKTAGNIHKFLKQLREWLFTVEDIDTLFP